MAQVSGEGGCKVKRRVGSFSLDLCFGVEIEVQVSCDDLDLGLYVLNLHSHSLWYLEEEVVVEEILLGEGCLLEAHLFCEGTHNLPGQNDDG